MAKPLYQEIAIRLNAMRTCEARGNKEWKDKHEEWIETAVKKHFPSGSGFDAGTKLDDNSTDERLIFNTSFHHMDGHGYYDGWTDHCVIVTPSLMFGFKLRVTGRDKNQIKEYILDCFYEALMKEVEE